MHPELPVGGVALADLFRGRGIDLEAAHARLKRLMDAEGLPFEPRERTYGTRLAQELGKWGERQGKPEIHDALYRAVFVEGAAVDRPETLVRVAEGVGLDPVEAARILEARSLSDEVDADWKRARELGVTGVPTFVAGGEAVVGAQPYELLEELVRAAGAQPRR